MRGHQCPRCELRFTCEPELQSHLIDEHHLEPETVEHRFISLPPDIHERRRPPDPTRLSLVDGPTP